MGIVWGDVVIVFQFENCDIFREWDVSSNTLNIIYVTNLNNESVHSVPLISSPLQNEPVGNVAVCSGVIVVPRVLT